MATIQDLEYEIQFLQNQLRQQSHEAEAERQRMLEEHRRRLKEYEREMKQAILRHDRETQATYERLLADYQSKLNADVDTRLAQSDHAYQRLLNSVIKSENALRQKNEELRQAVEGLKKETAQREAGNADEAWSCLQKAATALRTVQAKPHEKFAPHRLHICTESLKDGNRLFGAGMYEAAAAVAISSEAALERLGDTIDEQCGEWEEQYELFCLRLACLNAAMEREIGDWASLTQFSAAGEERSRRTVEMDFWSMGEYSPIRQLIATCDRIQKEAEQEGKNAYWNTPDSASAEDLKNQIASMDKAVRQLDTCGALCRQRYIASCQRAAWGEAIVAFLTEEINLVWLDTLSGFQTVDEETAASPLFRQYMRQQFGDPSEEDVRRWLRLVFVNDAGNRIYLYLLPEETETKVVNRVVLHIDFEGAENEAYSRDLYRHVCEAVGLTDDEGIVSYVPDTDALKTSRFSSFHEAGRDIEQLKKEKGSVAI